MKKTREHITELQNRSVTELEKLAAAAREEVRELNFKAQQNQLKTVRVLREKKREIARILTIITAKKRTAAAK